MRPLGEERQIGGTDTVRDQRDVSRKKKDAREKWSMKREMRGRGGD